MPKPLRRCSANIAPGNSALQARRARSRPSKIGQVDTLLLSAAPDAVHDDTSAGTAGDANDMLEGGDPVPIAERLVRLAQQTSAGVRFIEDTSLLADVGGVGATLRYRLDPRAIWKEGLP